MSEDLSIYPEEMRRRIEAHEKKRAELVAELERFIGKPKPKKTKHEKSGWLARLLGL